VSLRKTRPRRKQICRQVAVRIQGVQARRLPSLAPFRRSAAGSERRRPGSPSALLPRQRWSRSNPAPTMWGATQKRRHRGLSGRLPRGRAGPGQVLSANQIPIVISTCAAGRGAVKPPERREARSGGRTRDEKSAWRRADIARPASTQIPMNQIGAFGRCGGLVPRDRVRRQDRRFTLRAVANVSEATWASVDQNADAFHGQSDSLENRGREYDETRREETPGAAAGGRWKANATTAISARCRRRCCRTSRTNSVPTVHGHGCRENGR